MPVHVIAILIRKVRHNCANYSAKLISFMTIIYIFTLAGLLLMLDIELMLLTDAFELPGDLTPGLFFTALPTAAFVRPV